MKKRGITLLETIVSAQILLIVSLFCMAVFGQGQRHDLRARQFSTCSFLANQKMQELHCVPPEQLKARLVNPETGAFPGEFSDYTFQATLSPYEDDIGHLEVVARSHLGCLARCSLLVSLETVGRGVTVDRYTNRIYYVGTSAGQAEPHLSVWNDEPPGAALPDTPAHGSALPLGAVAGVPGADFVWAIGPTTPLSGFSESPPAWVSSLSDPPVIPAPQWSGLCSDAYTGLVVASDAVTRCLWLHNTDDAAWNPIQCKPVSNPLGVPGALATDDYASLVWVVDREHNCLRKFLWSSDAPAPTYPPSLLEAWPPAPAAVQGYWDIRSFRPGNGFLGTPQGIAMDEQGHAVFVLDRAGIWSFIETDGASAWQRVYTFPSPTRASGLATDQFGGVFYVNCADGRLLKIVEGSPNWTSQQLVP